MSRLPNQPGELINRDEGVLLKTLVLSHGCCLLVTDEREDLDAREHGGVVMTVTFIASTAEPGVFRHLSGTRMAAPGEEQPPARRPGKLAAMRLAGKVLRIDRTGLNDAGPEEIRQAIFQLEGAEPLPPRD